MDNLCTKGVNIPEKYRNIIAPPAREARAQEIKAIADKRIQMKKDIANARRRETNFINKEHRIKGKNLKSAEDSAKIIMSSSCTSVYFFT